MPAHRPGRLHAVSALRCRGAFRTAAFLAGLLAATAFVAAASPAEPRELPEWIEPVAETGAPGLYRFTSPNGLEALVDSRPGTRTAFLQIGVRVGARDEDRRHAGMSHLLEHLLFKEGHAPGAEPNPAYSALRAAGGLINASTDFELTEYHADVDAARFEDAWDALVALVTQSEFTDEDVETERRIVLQEVALGKTDPLAIMAYSVLRRVFPGDPIGQPVIGFRKTLKRIDKTDLDAYYDRFYTPANMFVVIVGDVGPVDAARRVRDTLGSRPARGASHAPYPEPQPRLRSLYRFRTLVKQSYLLAGALTGGYAGPDAPALDVLAQILGGGRTSRLNERLIEREALTREILALAFSVSNTGAFGAGLAVDRKKTDVARAALQEELHRLASEPVPQAELDRVRRRMLGSNALQFETNSGVAYFRSHRMFLRRPVSRDAWRAEFEGLTPDDLLAAAKSRWGAEAVSAGKPGLVRIEVLPARGPGKLIAALKFLIFRRL